MVGRGTQACDIAHTCGHDEANVIREHGSGPRHCWQHPHGLVQRCRYGARSTIADDGSAGHSGRQRLSSMCTSASPGRRPPRTSREDRYRHEHRQSTGGDESGTKSCFQSKSGCQARKKEKDQAAQKSLQPERLRSGKDRGLETHRAVGSDIDRAASAWHSICRRIFIFCDGKLHGHRIASADDGRHKKRGADRQLRARPHRGR